ncbi:MAG: aspartate aminotransferase family protein [Acidisphaera sp.]|nr:aspartate aminotransferase family protein [Acidisphaera sp.]
MSRLDDLDAAHLLHSLGGEPADLAILAEGSGATIVDVAGRRYLDAVSGVWNACLGYGVTELGEAAAAQFGRLGFGSTYAGFSNPPAIELAARLAALAGRGLAATFFTASGADANEAAFKTARFYWRRMGRPDKVKVLYLEHGFAGMTLATMSASGIAGFAEMFGPRLPGFVQLRSPYPYGCDFARPGETPGMAAARLLEEAVAAEDASTVAALILETVQGAGGVIVLPEDFLREARRICTRHGILLIVDEVITGFGRTGRWFGMQHVADFAPDMLTFGKAATAGHLPLGGLMVSGAVTEAIRAGRPRWMHSSTFSGNPVCCAVALKAIEIIERDGLLARVERLGGLLRQRLAEALDLSCVGEVRGLGLIVGVELVADRASRRRFPAGMEVGARVRREAQARGVLVRNREDVINLAPPYVVSEPEIERIAAVLRESIASATQHTAP